MFFVGKIRKINQSISLNLIMMRNIKKKAKITHYLFLLIFLIEKIITNAQRIIIVHEMVFGRQDEVILV